jgi:hypothetical protein
VIETSVAPSGAVLVQPSAPLSPTLSADSDASIAAYVAAGDRMYMLAGMFGLVCVGLIALLLLAFALGLLSAVVRLV